VFFRIGARMFGQVPTPERLMAHRLPLMLGLGGLYGASSGSEKSMPSFAALLNVMSEECLVRLREHFVGYQTFASKFAKAFRIAPQGFSS
jgi:hypothetical protein